MPRLLSRRSEWSYWHDTSGLLLSRMPSLQWCLPWPKTYVAPKEIDGLVGDLVVSGDFRVGATTVVTVPIDHFGDGTGSPSIKWRYLRPDGSQFCQTPLVPMNTVRLLQTQHILGQTIEILANVQQSDPDNSALKHIYCQRQQQFWWVDDCWSVWWSKNRNTL